MSASATAWRRTLRSGLPAALLMLAATSGAPAQAQSPANKGVPNALQGFSENRGQPIAIEASRLEVRDKSKIATFSGNVKVVQGDTTLRCKSLVVFYEEQAMPGAAKAATPGPGGSQQISKLEARGGVVVTQKDQTATGELGLFDMRTNTVTLSGGVVVSQGQNVVQGDKLVVDLTTGVSRVDAGKSNAPVRMLIQQQPGGPGQTGPFGPGRSFPN
jgi:lipopolysaccharide export system protein LptA